MTSDNKSLNNLTVLVTRPSELAGGLCRLIEQAGGRAIVYPVISIESPTNTERLNNLLASLDTFDIAIFISPSAVRKTFELTERLPGRLSVAAIGSSTKTHLEKQGVAVDIVAPGHNSESLLEHPLLQSENLSGKKIMILRGEGGRALLGDTLHERGAQVQYAETYRRTLPAGARPLSAQRLDSVDIMTVTSAEGLDNLVTLCAVPGQLMSIPVMVPGARVTEKAHQLGFTRVIRIASATDQAFLQALVEWHSRTI